jgi:outer membrane protein insertion porin family
MFGVAASTDSGLSAQISYSQSNFDYSRPPRSWRDVVEGRAWVGGGQSFALEAMPGTEFTRYSFAYKDPRVNDSKYSFGLNSERWERGRETYTETRTSGGVSIGSMFGRDAFWEVSATTGVVEVDELELTDRNGDSTVNFKDAPKYLADVYGANTVNLLGFSVGHDTRNSFRMPTEGHRIKATLEASSKAIASEYDFLRVLLEGRWYRELSRDELDRPHVFLVRARVGTLFPNNDDEDSPIFERFFAGGSTDVRGFEFRGLGPRDDKEPLGGELLTVGGLQYEFPLVGDNFRGVVFWDTGGLFLEPEDFEIDDLRNTVGVGFRFRIPPPLNMPIGIDLGFPVKDEDEDENQVFSVGFGRAI